LEHLKLIDTNKFRSWEFDHFGHTFMLGSSSFLLSVYQEHVGYGQVKDCLQNVVNEIDPHVIVLGRHQSIHRKPLGIGKLPLNSIIYSEIPVIIAV
jgi:hypothetical protein